MLPIVTDQVYVLRPPVVTDAHGNRSRSTKDWENATRTGPFDACVQPDSATLGASLATKEERRGGREQLSKSVQVFLQPGTDVLATDGLEIGGRIWQVNGEPFELPDVGGLGHMICKGDWIEG
ncbi:hypothetical protein [Nocardiopsis tropica]|uniref:Head-to-tail stopper n=1 Tax=Nocardiopsis tropica TaxID=109330 RepID=A0ABU7KQZ3_9ACTN|nr:hypothetical protein [Nocardiopsis umidischolae]MEE2051696.1 hypothetical protein [Nocardiopsis umidischolae]